MTRFCLMIGVLVLLTALAAVPAAAAPSLLGYTGLLLVPSADALNDKEFNVAYFTLNVEEGADEKVFAANLGIDEGTEIGFARLKPDYGDTDTVISGKYQFQPEDMHKPAMAVGVFDLTDQRNTTVYFVASMSLSRTYRLSGRAASPRIHMGVGGGGARDGKLDGLFAGATVVLGERLTLIGEYDTADINLGARLALGREVRAHAGWINGLDDVAIGASYNKMF